MSRRSCCTILVWVLLQLIYFSSILMNCVISLEQMQFYQELYSEMEIYFTHNLQYELCQKPVDGWKSSDFGRQCVTEREPLSPSSLRNIVSTMGFEVQKKRSVLTSANNRYQNVNGGEKSVDKSEAAFSFQRLRKYTVAINNVLTIYSLKLTHISKCSNLLAEQIAREGMKLIDILRNRNSRFSATMQELCMIDDNSYTWIFELRHKPISNCQNTVNIFLRIQNWDLKNDLENFEFNCTFKGSWGVCVQISDHNVIKANLFRVPTVSNTHTNNCYNCNVSNSHFSHFEHNRNSFQETLRAPNENSFIKETNSRKNRLLLSVNSDSNSNKEKRDSNTSQKFRHARNKRIQSMNNQKDSPNDNRYATKVERRRERKSRRLAKDLTFAVEAKRATSSSSSREADATKRTMRISFYPDNEADYRREIDRQIEADFAKIKDTLRLEKAEATSSEMPRRSLNTAKNNRQSVSQPAIDTRESEIITGKQVCIAPHCQQVMRHGLRVKSPDSNELPANSRGSVASEQNGIAAAAVAPRKVVDEKIQLGANDERKLIGEALIILNKDASPFTIVQKSNDSDVNVKYSVESISLGLDELVKMGKEVMKEELDSAGQNETKKAGLSCKNCLKYAKGNNDRGLEDDEATKLEEQLKELRPLHIQRERGFTNSGKNEMRFASGDEYTFRNDEAARLNNEYSRGHVRQTKKRCRHKKYKSPPALNTSMKSSNLMQNGSPYYKKMEKISQNLSNDVPPREYQDSSIEGKLLSDKKVVVYSRNNMKSLQEAHLPSKNKDVSERQMQTLRDSHVTFHKSKSQSNIPCKSINRKSHKIIKKNLRNRQSLSMSQSLNNPLFQIKKKSNLPQSLPSRKLKSVEAGEILREAFLMSKSDTLSRYISNYYNCDAPKISTDSLYQAVENRNMKTNAPRRKLLSSNSMEYGEGSSIPADDESNYDYVEKLYGDQLYEKGPFQLHYFQINLRNDMLLAKSRMEREASRIELAQCHADKSMETTSVNHKTVSETRYHKRTLKSIAQEEHSGYSDKRDSVQNLYLSGDLIGYNYDPEENDNQEKFKRDIDENEDPDLARLFANGQEYDINVKGKLHLRLKDPESNVASEQSLKKMRYARPKIEKSRKKLAQAERKFAVLDKRTKRNPDKDTTDILKEDGNLKSKVSNKMRTSLKKISDFFKRKFTGGCNKKKMRKKIHAKEKIVRLKPGQGEDNSQSTFSPFDQSTTTLESRRGDCKCAHETSTTLASEFTIVATDTSEATEYITQPTESDESITEDNDSNYEVYSNICHCRKESTEMSSIITRTTPQYVTNQPEAYYSSTKAELSREIVSEESPETISTATTISTNGLTEKTAVIPSNCKSSGNSQEQKAKMKNVLEILNFIKNLEKILKNQKIPFRIEDENGSIEIKLEKIYIRPEKNQSVVELKAGYMSDVGDTSEVIRESDAERPISPMLLENVQSLSNPNSKFSSNTNIKNDLNDNIFDETSQILEKPKNYDDAIIETNIETSVPKFSQADKKANNDKSLPVKQWIDEQRIASDDQSSSRGQDSTLSDRKRKKRHRKKKRRRLRKRNVNETGIASKKGKAPYWLRRRRRRHLSRT